MRPLFPGATARGVGGPCRSLLRHPQRRSPQGGQAAVGAQRPVFLGALVLALVAVAAACGDDGENGGPTGTGTPGGTPADTPAASTPTATSAATPRPGEASGWEGFREFAAKMETALAEKDVEFFLDRAHFSEYTCPGPNEFNPCEREGQVLHVVAFVPVLPSEPTLLESDAVRDTVQRFVDGAQPEQSDDYGDGALRLYSISRRGQEGGDQEYWALITKISTPEQSPQRDLMILRFRFQDGRWEYVTILQGFLLEGFGVEAYFSQAPEDLNWERRQQ